MIMMKKTLVALALAATTVSGSAMAWTANGTGGDVDFGGTVTVAPYSTWEILVGSSATGLDGNMVTGDRTAKITLKSSLPVLGIRTNNGFSGDANITPQINFGGKVDLSGFNGGETTLTLDFKDTSNVKKGVMTVPFSAAALVSKSINNGNGIFYGAVLPKNAGDAFFGGLSTSLAGVSTGYSAVTLINNISSDYAGAFDDQGASLTNDTFTSSFDDNTAIFSSYYGAGILSGKQITLTFDSGVPQGSIQWRAQLPVTVSYQ
ncbi:fimbrial protein [Citrobacter braakii]